MRGYRIIVVTVIIVLALAGSVNAAGLDSSFLRSLIIPGSGQAHKGHYTKAAFFASSCVATGIGLFISQIHYNRAVERYDKDRAEFLALGGRVERGEIVNYGDIEDTYAAMKASFEQAKRRYRWRNVFLAGLIGSYTLNLIDVIISKPAEKRTTGVSLKFTHDGFRLVKTFDF